VGGHSVIPKSVTASRIVQNFVQVELTDDEIAGVNALGKENLRFNVPWVVNDPKWPINIFGHPGEKDTPHKVIL
jgi:L-glyceraldehyde reductase